MSTALFTQGKLEAMRGRFDEARALIESAGRLLADVSLPVWTAAPFTQQAGWVELLAGDAIAAEQKLRRGVDTLREIGELAWMPTEAGILAESLYVQGRLDDAEECLQMAEEVAGADDAYSVGLLRSVHAKVLAQRGDAERAIELGREAVDVVEPTDFLFLRAFALMSLGEALQLVGRDEDASEILDTALQTCDEKGFSVGAERVRAILQSPARPGR
jgi:tetratricopeptide (TPR) repeat protein